MSLRDELLNEVADIIESTGVEESNPMWHRVSSRHYAKQILECISKHLPEKRPDHKLSNSNFNKAIDEVNKLLTTNKKGKV